jgi:hypothetical protein
MRIFFLFIVTNICLAQIEYPSLNGTPEENRVELQNIVNALNSSGGGVIMIPRGVHLVNKNPTVGAYYLGAILLTQGKYGITFKGYGKGVSVLKLAPGSYTDDCHIFLIRDNVSNISFEDLTLDGSRGEHSVYVEQMHGIETNGGVKNLYIKNVEFKNTVGDGIRLLGYDSPDYNDKTWIEDCDFNNNGRSGVTVQRGTKSVWIKDNVFSGVQDQSIDFEPTGNESATEYIITGNIIRHTSATEYAMTLGGNQSRNVLISNNLFLGGSIYAQNADKIKFNNNTIEGKSGISAITIIKRSDGFEMINNTIKNVGTQAAIDIYRQSSSSPYNIFISSNNIECAGVAIRMDGVYDIKISNNKIKGNGGICFNIGNVQNINSELGGITIENNDSSNFNEFLVFDNYYSTNVFRHLKVIGNTHFDYRSPKQITKFTTIKNPLNGTGRYIKELLITDNVIDGNINSTSQVSLGSDAFKYFKIRDGRQQEFIASQTPENLIFAPKGSITTRTDESGIYSKLTKSTPETLSTGWVNTSLSNYIKLVEDAFSNPSTLSAHIPDLNITGSQWVENGLTWSVNNSVNVNSTGNGVATIDCGSPDGLIKVNVKVVSLVDLAGGIVFRYQDNNNYWMVALVSQYNKFRIIQRVNGQDYTRIESSFSMISGATYTIDVLLKGNQIKATIDGSNDLNYNSQTGNTNTKHGLGARVTSRYYFDNFSIFK